MIWNDQLWPKWHEGYCHSEISNVFIQLVNDLVLASGLDLPGCASRWEGRSVLVWFISCARRALEQVRQLPEEQE